MSANLFSPLEIRGVRLKNRIVASPMWQYSGENGKPTATHAVHLGRQPHPAPLPSRRPDEVQWCGTGDSVDPRRPQGAEESPWAAQRPGPPDPDWPVLGPSPLPIGLDGFSVPRQMSLRDIADTVESWVQAAHGYLIHTFLSPVSNRRSDHYGGSNRNRSRLLMEIVDGIRTVWPAEKALFIRLSCVDVEWGIDRTVDLVQELQSHDVDVIDCSAGGLTGLPVVGVAAVGYGYQVPYVAEMRACTQVKTMAVGLIVHAEQAQAIIENGQADLVALGRELLYNPNWPIDAARKLGVADPYSHAPLRVSHWLRKRDGSFDGFAPSTEGSR